jgi:hypothetical protein
MMLMKLCSFEEFAAVLHNR